MNDLVKELATMMGGLPARDGVRRSDGGTAVGCGFANAGASGDGVTSAIASFASAGLGLAALVMPRRPPSLLSSRSSTRATAFTRRVTSPGRRTSYNAVLEGGFRVRRGLLQPCQCPRAAGPTRGGGPQLRAGRAPRPRRTTTSGPTWPWSISGCRTASSRCRASGCCPRSIGGWG